MPALSSKPQDTLQAPNRAATKRRRADADGIMRAALAREYAKPCASSSIEAAKFFNECCDSALVATDPADPRYFAMWAQAMRAHRDLAMIEAASRKANKADIRRRGKREREYWRERLAM